MFRSFGLLLVLFLLGGVVTFAVLEISRTPSGTTINSQVVVQEMRRIGRLELVHYRLQDVLDYRVDQPSAWGIGSLRLPRSGKVLLVVSGEAIGCIDLARLDSSAIQVQDSVVTVRLPPAELCVVRVDHAQTRVYDATFTPMLFSDSERGTVLNQAYRQAEQNIRQAALRNGILAQTNQQAQAFLTPLLRQLGIRQVRFVQPG